jgi:hypothetical protein
MPTKKSTVKTFSVSQKIPDGFSDFCMGLMALVVSRSPELSEWAILEVHTPNQQENVKVCLYYQKQIISKIRSTPTFSYQNYSGMIEIDTALTSSQNVFGFWNSMDSQIDADSEKSPFDLVWASHPWEYFIQKYTLTYSEFKFMSSYGSWSKHS